MPVTWITGNSGAGKTTLAKKIIANDGGILLDGDELRKCWSDLDFSEKSRREQSLRAAKIAKMLDAQGLNVIVSVICPYKNLRREVYEITNCRFIYLTGGKPIDDKYVYEAPDLY